MMSLEREEEGINCFSTRASASVVGDEVIFNGSNDMKKNI